MFSIQPAARLAFRWGLLLAAFAAAIFTPPLVHAQAPQPSDPVQIQPDCKPKGKKIFLPLVSHGTLIGGKVTLAGRPAAGVFLALYNLKTPSELAGVVQTDAQGNYAFTNPPAVPTGSQGYRVVYENGKNGNPVDALALAWWEGPRIPTLSGGTVSGGNFDIADIALASPASGAALSLPAAFAWTPRGVNGDDYEFNLLDSAYTYVFWSNPRLGAAGSYTLSALPPGVTAGTKHWWIMWVYAPDGGRGAGRVMRAVSFTAQSAQTAPNALDRDAPAPVWAATQR